MSKTMRIAVLACALLSSLAVSSSTATAVTWHNTGDTAFTATGGASTLTTTGVNFTCAGQTGTGTSPAGSTGGATYPFATITSQGTGCQIAGIPTSYECHKTLTATGSGPGGISGAVDLTCRFFQFGANICHLHGVDQFHYRNPVPGFGILTWTHVTLRMTNGSAGPCPLGANEPVTLPHETWIIISAAGGPAPHTGPVITRTA